MREVIGPVGGLVVQRDVTAVRPGPARDPLPGAEDEHPDREPSPAVLPAVDDRVVVEPLLDALLSLCQGHFDPVVHDEAGDVAGDRDRAELMGGERSGSFAGVQAVEVVADDAGVRVEQGDGLAVTAMGDPPRQPGTLTGIGEGVVLIFQDGPHVGHRGLAAVHADRRRAQPFAEVVGVDALIGRDQGNLLLGAWHQRLG